MCANEDIDVKDLIGKTIEVFVDIDNNTVKEILVKDVYTNSKGKCIIEDSEGNTYSEDSINWHYKLSLGSCLAVWLDKYGYIDMGDMKWNAKEYEEQLEDLFELLCRHGYLEHSQNEK